MCILFGGITPLVLRKVAEDESKWRLMGPCFVHGRMDGETMKDAGIGQRSLERI